MNVEERVDSLKSKHARLQVEIDEEIHRPMPDSVHLAELKRERLRIKDEIEQIDHHH